MFKPREIRSAFGKMAFVLSSSAAAHNRRRAAAPESGGNVARASKVPQDHARFQLFVSLEVRPEERVLLSGYERGSYEMSWEK